MAEQKMKVTKYFNKEKKEIQDRRRTDCINKVRRDLMIKTEEGNVVFQGIYRDIDERIEQNKLKERAKSATAYNRIKKNSEIFSTGINIS